MSDLLVQLQDKIAQYPTWMVAGVIGFVVVVIVVLLWKAMRIAIMALIVAALIAGGWFVWDRVSQPHATAPAPAPAEPKGR